VRAAGVGEALVGAAVIGIDKLDKRVAGCRAGRARPEGHRSTAADALLDLLRSLPRARR
jgi:hypothetical protein